MFASHHGIISEKRSSAQRGAVISGRSDVRIANALLLLGVIVMAAGYLAMINRSATKGFMIRTMEQKISALEQARKKLDLEALASQSMASIEGQVDGLGFVAVTDIEYLSGATDSVAVR